MEENDVKSIYEEEIFIGHYDGDNVEELIKYYLSNDFNEIVNIINRHIVNKFPDVNQLKWESNTNQLAEKVKNIMNNRNVNYSMAICPDRNDMNIMHVAINFRDNNDWYFFGGVIIQKKYFTYEEVEAY